MAEYRIAETIETRNVYLVVGADAKEAIKNLRNRGPQVFVDSVSEEVHTIVKEVITESIFEEETEDE